MIEGGLQDQRERLGAFGQWFRVGLSGEPPAALWAFRLGRKDSANASSTGDLLPGPWTGRCRWPISLVEG